MLVLNIAAFGSHLRLDSNCLYVDFVSVFFLQTVSFIVLGTSFLMILCCRTTDYQDIVTRYVECIYYIFISVLTVLQCFDAVGWVAGRASGL